MIVWRLGQGAGMISMWSRADVRIFYAANQLELHLDVEVGLGRVSI